MRLKTKEIKEFSIIKDSLTKKKRTIKLSLQNTNKRQKKVKTEELLLCLSQKRREPNGN
jgi:hypothetical protein